VRSRLFARHPRCRSPSTSLRRKGRGKGWSYPTLSPEKRRKDGARGFLCWLSELLPMHERVECFASHPFGRKKANAAMRNQQGLKAQTDSIAFAARLNSLRKKAISAMRNQQGLKPGVDSAAFAARVNSCPDTNHLNNRVFPQAVKSCPDTNHLNNRVFPQAVKPCPFKTASYGEFFRTLPRRRN